MEIFPLFFRMKWLSLTVVEDHDIQREKRSLNCEHGKFYELPLYRTYL